MKTLSKGPLHGRRQNVIEDHELFNNRRMKSHKLQKKQYLNQLSFKNSFDSEKQKELADQELSTLL